MGKTSRTSSTNATDIWIQQQALLLTHVVRAENVGAVIQNARMAFDKGRSRQKLYGHLTTSEDQIKVDGINVERWLVGVGSWSEC